jgi:hypothetical protein
VASEFHVPLGTVPGYGGDIEVCRHPDGSAAISAGWGVAVSVPAGSVAPLAELLNRAAMPGVEVTPPADVVTAEIWCGLGGCINGPGEHLWHVTCQERDPAHPF